jgi:hypothetical protein
MRQKRVIFLDLNLIADVPYAKELFTALIPLKIQWAGLATTTIAWMTSCSTPQRKAAAAVC